MGKMERSKPKDREKRLIVEDTLRLDPTASNNQVAKKLGVSPHTVRKCREALDATIELRRLNEHRESEETRLKGESDALYLRKQKSITQIIGLEGYSTPRANGEFCDWGGFGYEAVSWLATVNQTYNKYASANPLRSLSEPLPPIVLPLKTIYIVAACDLCWWCWDRGYYGEAAIKWLPG